MYTTFHSSNDVFSIVSGHLPPPPGHSPPPPRAIPPGHFPPVIFPLGYPPPPFLL